MPEQLSGRGMRQESCGGENLLKKTMAGRPARARAGEINELSRVTFSASAGEKLEKNWRTGGPLLTAQSTRGFGLHGIPLVFK